MGPGKIVGCGRSLLSTCAYISIGRNSVSKSLLACSCAVCVTIFSFNNSNWFQFSELRALTIAACSYALLGKL